MRVVKACDRCRSHKIKCSGECPCATCLKQAKECTFSNKVFQKEQKGLELPEPKRAKYAEPFGLPEVKKTTNRNTLIIWKIEYIILKVY